MSEYQETLPLAKNELLGIVARLFAEEYRLVQIGCTTLAGSYELNYSFDKDYRFKNFRITVTTGEEVPSITTIYHNAFLYENEIHDLFGIPIKNIVVDYQGTLYRTAIATPFSIGNCPVPEPSKPKKETPQKPSKGTERKGETTGKTVAIEEPECTACGACVDICPEVFSLKEGAQAATVIKPTGGPEDLIRKAIDGCPTSCISLTGPGKSSEGG
jgi:ech hydrogenase subunit D